MIYIANTSISAAGRWRQIEDDDISGQQIRLNSRNGSTPWFKLTCPPPPSPFAFRAPPSPRVKLHQAVKNITLHLTENQRRRLHNSLRET